MENLIRLCKSILDSTKLQADNIECNMGKTETSRCLNVVYNNALICKEALLYYQREWNQESSNWKKREAKPHGEEWERCMIVTKSMFISIVSAIEYSMRKIIDSTPDHVLATYINRSKKGYDQFIEVYKELDKENQQRFSQVKKTLNDLPPCDSISKIISKSEENNLITHNQSLEWGFILEIRNITVHNNCIGSRNKEMVIYDRYFEILKNEAVHDRIDIYLLLAKRSVELFVEWSKHQEKVTQ